MDDSQIEAIIDRVMREVGRSGPPPVPSPAPPDPARPAPRNGSGYDRPATVETAGQDGVFSTLDEAVAAANVSLKRLNALPLDIRKDMVAHMRQAGREYAARSG